MASIFLTGFVLAILLALFFWVLRGLIKNEAVADIAWSLIVAILCIYYAFEASGSMANRIFGAFLGAVWGFRLALYVFVYRIQGNQKDKRYDDAMQSWGNKKEAMLFGWFLLQGILASVFSVPFMLLCSNSARSPDILQTFFGITFILALCGGSLADQQLANFRSRSENRGKVCREGLWNYSRHPNYFFEVLLWLSAGLSTLTSPGLPFGLIPALLVTFFIFRVSGIPMTEQRALKSKGEAYREYQRTTSVFFPWFHKKREES